MFLISLAFIRFLHYESNISSQPKPQSTLANHGLLGNELGLYYPKAAGERKVLLSLLITSGLVLLVLAVFYALNPRQVIGDALVNTLNHTPYEVPPPGTFPFYLKPVTVFFVALVAFAYCFFALAKTRIQRLPRSVLAVLLLGSVVSIAVCAYEILFNFTLWGSLIVSQGNPDLIFNDYPVGSYRVNLVFATKSFVALLFVSYFSFSALRSALQSEST